MTGIYVRIQRGTKWENIEIEDLSASELRLFFEDKDKARVLQFFSAVTEWMRDNIREVSPLHEQLDIKP